jgi:Domain of unknown function (DUF4389)
VFAVDNPAASPVEPAGPLPVLLGVPPEPQPQNRMTVAFRLPLAIPHLIVLWALSIAAAVVAIIGWFGALFTGRLPQFAYDFLSGVTQWTARVDAYLSFLTDAYPPFAFGDASYPVRVAIPPPEPLNRLAVLFRFVLAIPAMIVAAVAAIGAWTIIAFAAWLCTLILGRLPAPLHGAYAAVVRFRARYLGYWWMLTPEYPWGLFGDRDPEATWPLRTSSGAKWALAAMLVVGAGGYASYAAEAGSTASNVIASAADRHDLDNAFNTLAGTVNANVNSISQCQSLGCASPYAAENAQALNKFASSVGDISMPTDTTTRLADSLAANANEQARLYEQAASASTLDGFNAIAGGTQMQAAASQLNSQYQQLRNDLLNR